MRNTRDLLDSRPRRSPLAVPLSVAALFLLLGGAFLLGRFTAPEPRAEEEALPAEEFLAEDDGGAIPGPAPGEAAEEEALAEAAPSPFAADEPEAGGLLGLEAEIRGSLGATLIQAVGAGVGDPLSLVASRLLVWALDVSRDMRPQDRIELVYEVPEGSEPVVHALRFHSHRLGRVLEAYRFQLPGKRFPRYYDEEGREIELRLQNGPIGEYEQITSLLKDGRGHQGVDFKAPVGTPVTTPFSGVVRRKNWNYRVNGGSLDIEDGSGRRILFLHLSEIEPGIDVGTRVQAGQLIARSGNTGRSTAPHLHYQLMSRAGRVLDPFDVHPTERRSIPAEHRAAFDAARAELIARFPGEAVTIR